MEQDRIAEQIWEYIDGTADAGAQQRIGNLIATDAVWRATYNEIIALNAEIAALPTEQPSMRFTKNVMESVAAAHISTPARQYIHPAVIKGIAAFFGISILLLLVAGLATIHWGNSNSVLPRLNAHQFKFTLPEMWNSQIGIVIGFANVILLIMLLDNMLKRRRNTAHP